MKKLVGGGILVFIGLFMTLGLLSGGGLHNGFAANLMMILMFILAPLGIGGWLIRGHFADKKTVSAEKEQVMYVQREKQILRLAQEKGGRLTIPEIAANTSMTTVDADAVMREMTAKGYVDMQVTDSGVIVYEFYDIIHKPKLGE